jgi:uncharacterized protein (DUF2141 family)
MFNRNHRATACVLLTALGAAWPAAAAETIDAELQISGLRSARGRVLVAAHAERSSFPSQWGRATAMLSVPAAAVVTVSLKLPGPGRYALIVVHDEDGDGRMSKNLIGLPKEGYTTGNNPQALEFPRFERSQVEFRESRRVELQLLYP